VKITGLGIDAALTGASSDDPGLADTHRLGMLLYATLTGHWPGPDCPTLPPAPVQDGLPCSPRQVRAGVPAVLDEITTQALMLDGRDGNALTTPDQLSAALVEAIPPVPIPQLPPPPSRPAPRPAPRSQTRGRSRADSHRHPPGPTREDMYGRGNPYGRPDEYLYPDEQEPGYWPQDGQRSTRPVTRGGGAGRGGGPARRGGASRSRTIAIVAVVVVVAVALVVFALSSLNHGGTKTPPPTSHHTGAPKTSSAAATLTPVGAAAFEDNPADANMAIDSNPSTAWQTFQYIGNPVFGGLQQGSGLILNMGHSVKLSSVKVTFQSTAGADVQIKIGNPSNPSPPQGNQADISQAESIADSMPTVAQQSNVSGTVTFTISSSDSGQYVLIWFTKLAPMPSHPNKYQGSIFNVVVTGSG
jgi:hypothetical protein